MDNGTNFIGARNDIMKLQPLLERKETDYSFFNYVAARHELRNDPLLSPHFRGFSEAAVKRMKLHIRRVIGTQVPSMEEFDSDLVQKEGLLNSRPLGEMSNDPNDIKALTPAHFLIGMPPLALNERRSEPQEEENLPECYRLQEKMKLSFWKSWSRD